MLKLLGTSSIASLGLSTSLFYWGGVDAVKGNAMKSFMMQFNTFTIPYESYNIPMNVWLLFTIISALFIAFSKSRAGKFVFAFLFTLLMIFAFSGRRTYSYGCQRREYWNSNTNSIDYY